MTNFIPANTRNKSKMCMFVTSIQHCPEGSIKIKEKSNTLLVINDKNTHTHSKKSMKNNLHLINDIKDLVEYKCTHTKTRVLHCGLAS